jgi:predicted metal-dependent hydrolase
MRHLIHQGVIEDLSVAWCDSNAVMTSVMEAISFVTPVLENFFVITVAAGRAREQDPDLDQRCLAFIREESTHSRAHTRFNASLLKYLGELPRGLGMVRSLLNGARKHLSLSHRLLLVAAHEHFLTVFSKLYLNHEEGWNFRSAFAKKLFAQHAREELAHRSVVFDLWLIKGTAGRIGRTLTVFAILFTGLLYVSVAVPWILCRKTGRYLPASLVALAGFAIGNCVIGKNGSTLRELFSFARSDYHPDRLIGDRSICDINLLPSSNNQESV